MATKLKTREASTASRRDVFDVLLAAAVGVSLGVFFLGTLHLEALNQSFIEWQYRRRTREQRPRHFTRREHSRLLLQRRRWHNSPPEVR